MTASGTGRESHESLEAWTLHLLRRRHAAFLRIFPPGELVQCLTKGKHRTTNTYHYLTTLMLKTNISQFITLAEIDCICESLRESGFLLQRHQDAASAKRAANASFPTSSGVQPKKGILSGIPAIGDASSSGFA